MTEFLNISKYDVIVFKSVFHFKIEKFACILYAIDCMHCNNCNSVQMFGFVAKYGTRLWLIADGTQDNPSAGRSASLSGNDLEGVQHLTG